MERFANVNVLSWLRNAMVKAAVVFTVHEEYKDINMDTQCWLSLWPPQRKSVVLVLLHPSDSLSVASNASPCPPLHPSHLHAPYVRPLYFIFRLLQCMGTGEGQK